MIWTFFIVVGLGLVAVIAAVVTSRLPYDPMSAAVATVSDPGLPSRPHARDVDGVSFDFALRGYRMDQVDDVLDALRDRLVEQDTVIARLRDEPGVERPAGTGTQTDNGTQAWTGTQTGTEGSPSPGPEHAPGTPAEASTVPAVDVSDIDGR